MAFNSWRKWWCCVCPVLRFDSGLFLLRTVRWWGPWGWTAKFFCEKLSVFSVKIRCWKKLLWPVRITYYKIFWRFWSVFNVKRYSLVKYFGVFHWFWPPPPPLHFLGPFRCSFGVLNWNSVQNGALICTFTMIREKEWSVGGMQEGWAFLARVGGVELDPTECSWQICVERAKKVSELSGIRWGMDGPLIKYKMKLLFKKQIPNSNFKQGECTERTCANYIL